MGEVIEFLRDRMAAVTAIGIPPEHLIIDSGIGFANTPEQNLELLREIEKLQILNVPILIGTLRKSLIGKILD
jgi:dihydropteroate synthase